LTLNGLFTIDEVSARVESETMGVYVLSNDGKAASYVGRSDFDLQQRIMQSASESEYVAFWFDYATSPMNAYKYKCELYHKYNLPDNQVHPAVPENTNWRCPVEGCE
jgi:hypothetical protein